MPAAIRSSGQMWNAAGEQQDTKFVIPDSSYARALRRRRSTTAASTARSTRRRWARRRTSASWRRRPRSTARTTRRSRSRRAGTVRVVDGDGATLLEHEVDAGDIWRMCQTQGRADPGLGASSRSRAPARPARPRSSGSTRRAPHDAELLKKVRPALDELDTDGPADRDPARRRGDALHARARPRRRGHDLRHRQRPARLPHRPLPDPRARDEREDALDRAAHERRRPVRDGRRRVGAQARPAVPEGEPPALGLARGVPRARGVAGDARREDRQRAREAPRRDARPGDRQRARERPLAVAQGAASSTTAAATSTSRCTGRRSSPAQTEDAELAEPLRGAWPSGSRADEEQIVAELAAVQGEPVDLGGYYRPDPARVDAVMRPSATLARRWRRCPSPASPVQRCEGCLTCRHGPRAARARRPVSDPRGRQPGPAAGGPQPLHRPTSPLVEALEREGAGWARERAREVGARVGRRADRAGASRPTRTRRGCKTHDRYGHRIDEVEFHPRVARAHGARASRTSCTALPWTSIAARRARRPHGAVPHAPRRPRAASAARSR